MSNVLPGRERGAGGDEKGGDGKGWEREKGGHEKGWERGNGEREAHGRTHTPICPGCGLCAQG